MSDEETDIANVQLVIQGKADECAIFLIDNGEIIKSIKQINAHHSHVNRKKVTTQA